MLMLIILLADLAKFWSTTFVMSSLKMNYFQNESNITESQKICTHDA